MRGKYQPKHMKEVDCNMKLPVIPTKVVVTAGLVGAMVMQSTLSPIAAVAAESAGVDSESATEDAASSSTAFSGATQRLIEAAQNKVQVSLEEAAALLAQVQAAADAAKGADDQQTQVVASANQTVSDSEDAVATASADKKAELQAQVDALNKQLSDAEAEVAGLTQQKATAEASKADLEGKIGDAKADAEAKQAVVDAAQKKLDEAQKALDDLGENPTADEQEAYDAAKAVYDAAVADLNAKTELAASAETMLNDLKGQLQTAKDKLADAESSLADKQRDAETAADELRAAKDNYASAVEAIETEATADEKAALEAAKQSGDEEKIAEAQAAYDNAVASAGAQAEAEANAEIQKAADAKAAADTALQEANDTITNAPGQIEDLQSQVADEEAKLSAAQKDKEDADAAVNAAQADVTKAEQALSDLAGEQAAWEEKAKPLKDALDRAGTALEKAKTEKAAADQQVTDLTGQLSSVTQQITDLENQIDRDSTQAVDDFCDFLAWLRQKTYDESTNSSDCSAALGYIAYAAGGGWGVVPGKNIEQYTHLGASDDASYIDNIYKALDMVDELNKLRASEGLSAVQVSLAGMVKSIYNANWSARTNTVGHAGSYGFPTVWGNGENAAWGYSPVGTFGGWYWQEKADYTQQPQTDPETGVTYQPHSPGDPNYQTGHYTNIVTKQFQYVGMAYANNGYYGSVAVNNFAVTNTIAGHLTTDESYTTDELRTLLDEAVGSGVRKYEFKNGTIAYDQGDANTNEQLNALKSQRDQLQSQLDAAKIDQANKGTTLTNAETTVENAQDALDDLGAYPTNDTLQQNLKTAQTALALAQSDASAAEQKLSDTTTQVSNAVSVLSRQIGDLNDKLTAAQNGLGQLTANSVDAKNAFDALTSKYATLTSSSEGLKTAQSKAALANRDLIVQQGVKDGLDATIEELTPQVSAAQSDYEAKKAEADSAGPTSEQIAAVSDAKRALDLVVKQVNDLTAARDTAKGDLVKAQGDKKTADGLVSSIENGIADNAATIEDAEAKLPDAERRVDVWTAVFGLQDPELIVTDGFSGTTDDADVAQALTAAHDAYDAKARALAAAEARLESARSSYEQAVAGKAATEQELADKLAELAVAQDAFDTLEAELKPAEEAAMQQAVQHTSRGQASSVGLAQTGDPATAMAAGMALIGIAAVAGGAHFRRRED